VKLEVAEASRVKRLNAVVRRIYEAEGNEGREEGRSSRVGEYGAGDTRPSDDGKLLQLGKTSEEGEDGFRRECFVVRATPSGADQIEFLHIQSRPWTRLNRLQEKVETRRPTDRDFSEGTRTGEGEESLASAAEVDRLLPFRSDRFDEVEDVVNELRREAGEVVGRHRSSEGGKGEVSESTRGEEGRQTH
jgi:hypothetical protein